MEKEGEELDSIGSPPLFFFWAKGGFFVLTFYDFTTGVLWFASLLGLGFDCLSLGLSLCV